MSSIDVLALTKALIERPSVTPEDAGCLDLLGAELAGWDFQLTRYDSHGVSNLWATLGSGHPTFAFAGHTDVVPPGPTDAWSSDPFTPSERGGLLYGRGAADMKSSLAAMVAATERFLHAHPAFATSGSGTLAFLLTSDEEGPATHGTQHIMAALEELDQPIHYCVVGEPSSTTNVGDVVRNGRRGSLNLTLTIQGVQGHVAYPEQVVNPIHTAAPALAEWTQTVWDEGNEDYPPTSLQISNIQAGTGANNVVPGTLQLLANFRFNTEQTEERLKQATEAVFARHNVEATFDWALSGNPFLTSAGDFTSLVLDSIETVTGIRAQLSTSGGTSDGRFIVPTGTQLVELGPVNESIHQIDEHVRIADLEPLTEIYAQILARRFA